MDSFTWPDVLIVFIPTIPGILAAYYGRHNAKYIETGNNKTLGKMVAEVHGEASTEATAYKTHSPEAEA